MGDFTDLVWVRIFSQTSQELEIFSPTYNGVRFFFSRHYTSWAIFFSVQDIIFPRNLFACFFPVEVNLEDIFLKSPITPSKVKWSAPKIHQTFGQLTDSDLSSFLKAFETIWDKTLQWRGEEFVSTYPYPEVRSDVRTGVR